MAQACRVRHVSFPYRLALPMPPSLNEYYENARRVVRNGPKAGKEYTGKMIGAAGLAFRGEVSRVARRGHVVPPKLSGPLAITVLACWPTHDRKGRRRPARKGDIDNLWKCLLDALTNAEVIADDVHFDYQQMMRGNPSGNGQLWLCITRFDPDAALQRMMDMGLPFTDSPTAAFGGLPF